MLRDDKLISRIMTVHRMDWWRPPSSVWRIRLGLAEWLRRVP